MKLSVIILNYNVRYFLELCLQSVESATRNINAEIIVADNNSDDDSCEMIEQRFPNVILIQNKKNLGFSKGNNLAVAQAKGEYLCILNPDTVVAEDTFENVLKFAESKIDLGIVGCQLIDGRGKFLPESKRQIPTPKVAFEKFLGKTNKYYTNTLNIDDIGKTDVLVGAFMLMKRQVYNLVHGFDEDYFMYGEDVDLSFKILKAGYVNYYYGKSVIIHYKGESTLKDRVYAQRFYGAMEIFYKKHFKGSSIFTALVKLGVKMASKRKISELEAKVNFDKTLVISDTDIENLQGHLKGPITFTSRVEEITKNTQIVFDSSWISYKKIIDFMKKDSSTNQNSYRILPKNSNFILGSDSSVSRGEVLRF